jgi:hypothetical protein
MDNEVTGHFDRAALSVIDAEIPVRRASKPAGPEQLLRGAQHGTLPP